MAVTLEWVRDNYDANKDRRIDKSESIAAMNDLIYSGSITREQFDAVKAAYDNNTLLPSYDTPAPPPTTVTLLWIRDHYDSNKDRHIDKTEAIKAMNDLIYSGSITKEQFDAVKLAYDNNTLLPAYDTPAPTPTPITCNGATPHHLSGCRLLKHYDADGDGIISDSELFSARRDRDDTRMGNADSLTTEEYNFVHEAHGKVSINALCPGCTPTPAPPVCTPGEKRCYNETTVETCNYNGTGWTRQTCSSGYTCINGVCIKTSEPIPVCTPGEKVCTGATTRKICKSDGSGWNYSSCPSGYECKNGECVKSTTPTPTPPNMETRTIDLTEGQHSIQVSLSGYNTLNATLSVSSTGVSCSSVTGGSCSTSGWTVTTGLTPATTTGDICSWITDIGGWRNLKWADHVLEAYYVYIGVSGHSVGFSPVTWDDVLGLYYYYINSLSAANGKTGCGFT